MVPGKASILGNASAPSSSPKTAAAARLELLRTTRARLLGNLRLPDRVKPSQVQVLLGLRRALDRLQSTALVLEQRRKKKK
jgi:hypothetical protein